jgi:predicted dehydrogenase
VPLFRIWTALLADVPIMDVVNICTPNGLHAQHALQESIGASEARGL